MAFTGEVLEYGARIVVRFQPAVESVVGVRFVEEQVVLDPGEVGSHILVRPSGIVEHAG